MSYVCGSNIYNRTANKTYPEQHNVKQVCYFILLYYIFYLLYYYLVDTIS